MAGLNRDRIHDVVAGVDWGFQNPGVILVFAVDYDGRMYLIHEVYRAKKLIEWWAKKAAELDRMYGISAFACDPSEPAYIQQFRHAGLTARPANNEILPGIDRVKDRLAVQPDGRPRLYFYRDCLADRDPGLFESKRPCSVVEELDCYVWSKAKDGRPVKDEPVKVNDHGCDALRYAVAAVDRNDKGKAEPPEAVAARARLDAEARARAQAEWMSPANEAVWGDDDDE